MKFIRIPRNPWFDLIILAVLLALFFSVGLGDRPYSAPSEARYVEIGREMAASGDYVTPRLNYVKYFEKPPLFYWIQAASTHLLGFDPFDARLPTMGFAVLLCLLTYGLGRFLYGRLAGILATLTLATSLYVFSLSRVVLVDMPVSVFLVATLFFFLYAAETQASARRTLVLYAVYAAAACAVLSKGLIGAVLPGVIVFLWLLLTGRWALLKNLRLVSGTLLFLLIAVPWHVLVARRNPEWAYFYFIHEHVLRFVTKEAGRYQPPWFFAEVFLLGFFPWIVFLWQALRMSLNGVWRQRFTDGKKLFLALWIGFIFVFFSLSNSKLIPYILPIFPPVAAMLGHYLAAAWREERPRGFHLGIFFLIGLFAFLAVLPSLLQQFMDAGSKVALAINEGGDDTIYLSVGAIIAAAVILITYIQGRARHVLVATIIAACVIIQLGNRLSTHYDKDSTKNLATTILHAGIPIDEVFNYQGYDQDLPIYLQRRISIVDWKGELEFGTQHEDTSAWMLGEAEFWRRWLKTDRHEFAIMRDDTYSRLVLKNKPKDPQKDLHLYGVQQQGRDILFMNFPWGPQPEAGQPHGQ